MPVRASHCRGKFDRLFLNLANVNPFSHNPNQTLKHSAPPPKKKHHHLSFSDPEINFRNMLLYLAFLHAWIKLTQSKMTHYIICCNEIRENLGRERASHQSYCPENISRGHT